MELVCCRCGQPFEGENFQTMISYCVCKKCHLAQMQAIREAMGQTEEKHDAITAEEAAELLALIPEDDL